MLDCIANELKVLFGLRCSTRCSKCIPPETTDPIERTELMLRQMYDTINIIEIMMIIFMVLLSFSIVALFLRNRY